MSENDYLSLREEQKFRKKSKNSTGFRKWEKSMLTRRGEKGKIEKIQKIRNRPIEDEGWNGVTGKSANNRLFRPVNFSFDCNFFSIYGAVRWDEWVSQWVILGIFRLFSVFSEKFEKIGKAAFFISILFVYARENLENQKILSLSGREGGAEIRNKIEKFYQIPKMGKINPHA